MTALTRELERTQNGAKIMERTLEAAALRIKELEDALSELIACKAIKERIAIEQATMIPETDDDLATLDRLMADYAQRQPKAWEAAHAALQGKKK